MQSLERYPLPPSTVRELNRLYDLRKMSNRLLDWIRWIYGFDHDHTMIGFTSDQKEQIRLMYDPWTMLITHCVVPKLVGRRIASFDVQSNDSTAHTAHRRTIIGLSHKDLFVRNKDWICVQRRGLYCLNAIEDLLSNTVPWMVSRIRLEPSDGMPDRPDQPTVVDITPELLEKTTDWDRSMHRLRRESELSQSQTGRRFDVSGNRIRIVNWIVRTDSDKEEFLQMCRTIRQTRDSYDEWIIDPGSGGCTQLVSMFLNLFVSKHQCAEERPHLWDRRVRRRPISYTQIPNSSKFEVDRLLGDYMFDGTHESCETESWAPESYGGKIRLIISNEIGSASYLFVLFFMLTFGKMRRSKEFRIATSATTSRVSLVGRTPQNRMSNTYTGHSGGRTTLEQIKQIRDPLRQTPPGTAEPDPHPISVGRANDEWVSADRCYLGYYFLGKC